MRRAWPTASVSRSSRRVRIRPTAVEQGRAAARRPSLAALGGYTRTNHVDEFVIVQPGQLRQVVYPDVPDNYRTRLDLQWLFYTGGRLDALERAARAERQATGEDLTAARADLRLEITRAFWALVTAREAEQVLARSLDSIGAYVRDLRARLDQGLIPPNELLSAEAQQSRERLVSIEAANARGDRRGRSASAARHAGLQPDRAGSAAGRRRRGRRRRRSADRRSDRASARAARARGARRGCARADGSGQGGPASPGRDRRRLRLRQPESAASFRAATSGKTPGTSRSTRPGRSGTAAGRAPSARMRRRWRGSPRRGCRISTGRSTFEVRQRQLELESSRAAIATQPTACAPPPKRGASSASDSRAGVVTNTEVLDAQTALLQAELERTRALANARLAEARLARAVGR